MFGKLLAGVYLIRYLLVLMAVYFILHLLHTSGNGFIVGLRISFVNDTGVVCGQKKSVLEAEKYL